MALAMKDWLARRIGLMDGDRQTSKAMLARCPNASTKRRNSPTLLSVCAGNAALEPKTAIQLQSVKKTKKEAGAK